MSLKDELRELSSHRAQLDERLVALEKQIYALEGTYLEETSTGGNILRGWDGYLSAAATHTPGARVELVPADRLFSLSSFSSDHNVALPMSSKPGSVTSAVATAAASTTTGNALGRRRASHQEMDEDEQGE
jgi:chromatin modification-related protein EAF6